jgi:hypothetical protein
MVLLSSRLLLRHLSLLTRLTALCSPPYIATPAHQPLGSSRRCHSRAHIEVEDGFASRLGLPGVVVDNVADLLLFAVDVARDVPIMTIKGWFGPIKPIESVSHPLQTNTGEETYANLAGYNQPITWSMAALGVMSCGRPWNLMSAGT